MEPKRPPCHRVMQRLYERGRPIARLLLLILILGTPGCGGTSQPADAAPASADAAHRAWVAAIKAGDANRAAALVDPELPEREPFARDAVGRMREYMTSPASPTGALEGVTLEPVVDGVGRSVWQFAQKRWCYRAEMISRETHWYISRWGQTSVDCR